MKDNQHEQLFIELTPVEAAVVEGGKSFSESALFDYRQTTQQFEVKPGGTIELNTNTANYIFGSATFNPTFYAAIRNVKTGNKNEKVARVGKDTTKWTNVRGGTYVIDFRDRKDDTVVAGAIGVSYS